VTHVTPRRDLITIKSSRKPLHGPAREVILRRRVHRDPGASLTLPRPQGRPCGGISYDLGFQAYRLGPKWNDHSFQKTTFGPGTFDPLPDELRSDVCWKRDLLGWHMAGDETAQYVDKKARAITLPTCPLYRLYSPPAEDHFYTADVMERQTFLAKGNYHSEGITAWICSEMRPGTRPLYRLHDGTDHFYTTSVEEIEHAFALGYRREGQIGFVFSSQERNTVPLCRLRHPRTGDHFYTISNAEVAASARLGFVKEGIVGYVYATAPL
jgi:hypothetical protein